MGVGKGGTTIFSPPVPSFSTRGRTLQNSGPGTPTSSRPRLLRLPATTAQLSVNGKRDDGLESLNYLLSGPSQRLLCFKRLGIAVL